MAENKVPEKRPEQPKATLQIRTTVKVGLTCSYLKTLYERDRFSSPALARHWKSQMNRQGCPS